MRARGAVRSREDEAFLPLGSKSPLIGKIITNKSPRTTPIVRYTTADDATPQTADLVAEARCAAEAAVPPVPPIDYTSRLPPRIMALIVSFLGNTPRQLASLGAVNRAWRAASYTGATDVTLCPDNCTVEQLEGATAEAVSGNNNRLESFISFFSPDARGQHVTKLTLVDPHTPYSFPQSYKGPTVPLGSLYCLLHAVPNLVHLDIRGVQVTGYVPVQDRLLSTLHTMVPCLKVLRVGACFVRHWEPCWWTRMPYLVEFVVGSRREDCDWNDSDTPLTLHDDFFTMLRSPLHTWAVVKLWPVVTTASLTALLFPTAPYPNLLHLSLNVRGSAAVMKPMEEPSGQETNLASKDEKRGRGGDKVQRNRTGAPGIGGQQDDASITKGVFPTLHSLTVADVQERPEFAAELLAKITQQAPLFKTFNVTNTHRTAPTHIEPPNTRKGRRRPAPQ